jgi:hypothetical protein
MSNFLKKITGNKDREAVMDYDFNSSDGYSVDEMVARLRANNKVDFVKVCLKESFSDEDEINYIWIVVKSHFRHGEFVKSLKVELLENGLYEVRMQLKKNPEETLIKDLYEKSVVKGKEWAVSKTPTENGCFSLKVDVQTLFKLVNWKYSVVNK